jgi:hypothetical protein
VPAWRWRSDARAAVASRSQDRQDNEDEKKTESAMVVAGKQSPQPVRSPYAPTDPGQVSAPSMRPASRLVSRASVLPMRAVHRYPHGDGHNAKWVLAFS